MGAACQCVSENSFQMSDIISIISMGVNILLTLWIVYVIQNKLNNKRVLKDHYITEIKSIREEFRTHLNSLYGCKLCPLNIIPWYKLMSIKLYDLAIDLNDIYCVRLDYLNEYQNTLRDLITESEDFNKQYNNPLLIVSPELKNEIIKFQQENSKTFNELIVHINNK